MNDERDETPMLSASHPQLSHELEESTFDASTRSASEAGTSFRENKNLGHTGPLKSERRIQLVQMSGPLFIKSKPEEAYGQTPDVPRQLTDEYSTYDGVIKENERLLKSGQLGMCNDPYCTTCPSYYNVAKGKLKRTSDTFDAAKFHNALYGDAKGWARFLWSFLQPYIPGVMNPHNKFVQEWNKFFVISCIVAIFADPLFFFALSVLEDTPDLTKPSEKYICMRMDKPTAITLVILRTINDAIYLFHMLLQFKLAYVSPESRVVGTGELVADPKKIARHYVTGFFLLDLFSVLPIPQVIILTIIPTDNLPTSSDANFAKNLIRAAILVQYIPRLYRFLPLLAGQSAIGFIFESAWANFIINLLTFILAGHVVGSCWYLFGLQRVNQCLRDACHNSTIKSCMHIIDCGFGNAQRYESDPGWSEWIDNPNAIACLDENGDFQYGIYQKAVKLLTHRSFTTRYVYSLFWGFQQISTVAGNQTPSYFVWEVLFTMAIIGLGLLLFALLIGNMQNFLQSLGRRRLEMSLRRRDVEQWMRHRRLPEALRRKVLEAERYSWAATRGVNEEMLMENLPEDLQMEIRRHLFSSLGKVRIFQFIDEPILDSIRDRLRQKTYIKGSKILYQGGFVDKMVFIVRGKLDSIGEDGIIAPLKEGDVCGEELLVSCLENSAKNQDGKKSINTGQRCPCFRTVHCVTNVEAFVLKTVDIQEVTSMYSRNLRNPRVQGALRYESPYWRCVAATKIQVAWRYRKKRLNRKESEGSYRWTHTAYT